MSPKLPKKKSKKDWKTVKIEGNVIAEDGNTLEGLIGLEVLENYNTNIVQTGKKKKKQIYLGRRPLAKYDDDAGRNDSGFNSSDEEGAVKKKKKRQKKQKNAKQAEPANIPGRFVLLKPPTDMPEEDEDVPELVGESGNLSTQELVHWNGLGVPEPILKAIGELGYKSPTEIQSLTLPAAIMGKKDILGAAETGSGKTLAFGIPILTGILELKRRNVTSGIRKVKAEKKSTQNFNADENLPPTAEELEGYPELEPSDDDDNDDEEEEVAKSNAKPLYALVLTPTRELAVQVRDHIAAVATYTGIKVAAIFGGLSAAKQERVLNQCPEIVVATPGRLWELLELENLHLKKLDDISFLVIDETDRMVEKGHFEELHMILKRLNTDETKMKTRQNFIFSATLTLVHDLPDHLQKKNFGRNKKLTKQTSEMKIQNLIESLGISQPKIVDITRSNQTAGGLTECRLICSIDHKDYYLYYFVQRHPGRTIVFCNSIGCVKRLAQLFTLLDCQPLPLHASMIQKQRLKNLEKFRANPHGLLIATDVAARGLDIPDVQHVIHYQVPRTSENYVHRSGRTARANKDGITIMIMEPGEIKNYLKLCRTLGRNEDLPIFPVSERHLNAVKERVNLSRDVDQLELKTKRETSEKGWLKKTAMEMDIVLEHENVTDSDVSSEDDENVIKKNRDRRLLVTKRQQLKSLLEKPLFPKGFSYKYPTSAGKLELPFIQTDSNSGSAIQAVKEAIKERKEARKRRNRKKTQTDPVL